MNPQDIGTTCAFKESWKVKKKAVLEQGVAVLTDCVSSQDLLDLHILCSNLEHANAAAKSNLCLCDNLARGFFVGINRLGHEPDFISRTAA